MTMANGTNTEKRLSMKPIRITKDLRPDAPEGEWKFSIPRGKIKVRPTNKDQYPMIIIPFRLDKAEDERNESFAGSEVPMMVTFFPEDDSTKRRASNMSLLRLRSLCEATGVEFDDVPEDINEKTLMDFGHLLEGKRGTLWTKHRQSEDPQSGETITNVDVLFRDPNKSGLKTRSAGEDDEPEEVVHESRKGKARRR